MSNNWNIPIELENKVRKRDKSCVYCHVKFKPTPKAKATWEHIINNAKNISEENIALCCASCNASKGAKKLSEWLANSEYCKKKGINKGNISI